MTGWEQLEAIARDIADDHGLKVLPRGMKSVYETYHPEVKRDAHDVRRIALYIPGTSHALWNNYDADEVAMLDAYPLDDDARDLAAFMIGNLARRLGGRPWWDRFLDAWHSIGRAVAFRRTSATSM